MGVLYVVAVGVFVVGVVGVFGRWWHHGKIRVVVCGLTVASLSLPVDFCSGPRFPSVLVVRVTWGAGLLYGVGGPRFVGGCFELGL